MIGLLGLTRIYCMGHPGMLRVGAALRQPGPERCCNGPCLLPVSTWKRGCACRERWPSGLSPWARRRGKSLNRGVSNCLDAVGDTSTTGEKCELISEETNLRKRMTAAGQGHLEPRMACVHRVCCFCSWLLQASCQGSFKIVATALCTLMQQWFALHRPH